MKNYFFKTFTDCVFYAFLSFSIAFTFFCYAMPPKASFVLSLTISLLCAILSAKLLINKEKNKKVKITEKKQYENMLNTFLFMTQSEKNNFFQKFISSFGFKIEKKKNALYLTEKNQFIFIKINFEQVCKTDIVRAFNCLNKNQTATIISQEFSSEIKSFAHRFDGKISLVNCEEIFFALKKHNSLPTNSYPPIETIKNKPNILRNVFNKKRAKNFFLFGLFFLFFGYFVPLKTYYVICGTIFLIISAISKIYGYDTAN